MKSSIDRVRTHIVEKPNMAGKYCS